MKITYTNSNPPASPQAIEKFEKSLGTTLPDDYKQFLLTENGGNVDYDLPYIQDDDLDLLPIDQLYGLSWDGENLAYNAYGLSWDGKKLVTYDLNYIRWQADEHFPLYMLELARVMGGHFSVIMSLLPDNKGSTYVCLDYTTIVEHIASSFTGFLEKLTINDE